MEAGKFFRLLENGQLAVVAQIDAEWGMASFLIGD